MILARRDDFLGHISLPMTEFYGKRTVDKYAWDIPNVSFLVAMYANLV